MDNKCPHDIQQNVTFPPHHLTNARLINVVCGFDRAGGVLPHAGSVAPCPSQRESSAARLFQPDASPEKQAHRDEERRSNLRGLESEHGC